MPKLKVFCTTSGFHDAIVAAPSKPAALKAWGAKTDLFSMGVARLVTDPKIARKALERPGEVIRLKRSGGGPEVPAPKKKAMPRAKPPSRARVATAERRLAQLEASQASAMARAERDLRAAEKKRDALAARHAKTRAAAELKLERAREQYAAALAQWEG